MIVTAELARSKGHELKDKWGSPKRLFNKLNDEFVFTLDPCCDEASALCKKFYTVLDNGLYKSWAGEVVFVNPPYSRNKIGLWVEKCFRESKTATVVGLLPVSTSSDWFHRFIIGKAQIRFVNKRIKFVGAKSTAPFSSMIVVWGRSGVQTFNQ